MRTLSLLFLLFGANGHTFSAGPSKAPSGVVQTDTLWLASMNPVELNSDLLVPAGITLTLSEGVEVFFSEDAQLRVEGSLMIRGASGQEILFHATGSANAEIHIEGPSAILSASHCHFNGSNIEVGDGGFCGLSDCLFDTTIPAPALLLDQAGKTRLARCRFLSVDRPIHAVRSRIEVEDCDFQGMAQEGIVLDSLLEPSTLRFTIPPRMVAGKTITFRAELLDEKGDLYWRMWEGVGTVSAVRHGTGAPVPLTKTAFRIINGIGSLTTSLDESGPIELRISVGGVSSTKTIEVLNANTQTLNLFGMLSPGHLDWGPADGVIRLSSQTIVPATGNLIVRAGALVMLDHWAELEVLGTLRVEGTPQDPVYFFATDPPLSWAQIRHRNSTQEMFYDYAIFTGGGVGPKETGEEHTFDGPILRFRPFQIGGGKGARISHCVFADNEGKGIFTHSGERYVISDCLFTRCEFGAEIHGDTVWIEDSYFLDLNTGNNDQDALYLWRSKVEHRLRRCILAYNGDDGIDTWESDVEVSDCLIYGSWDKNITLFLNDADITNCLFFGAQYGVQPRESPSRPARITQCTFADHSVAGVRIINAPADINRSILWGNTESLDSYPEPATMGIENSILNSPRIPIEGEGNRFVDPLFRDPAKKDYRLSPGSPGIGSGPNGETLGWLGFPSADPLYLSGPSVIRECRFSGGNKTGILLRHGVDCLVENCRFEKLTGAGVKAEGKNWFEVRSSLFADCDRGIVLERDAKGFLDRLTLVECATAGVSVQMSEAEVSSSILWNCGEGVDSDGNSEVTVDFSNIGPGAGSVFPGFRNLNTDPLFVDPVTGDFNLRPESPCIRSGSGRSDMGAFQTGHPPAPRAGWFLR